MVKSKLKKANVISIYVLLLIMKHCFQQFPSCLCGLNLLRMLKVCLMQLKRLLLTQLEFILDKVVFLALDAASGNTGIKKGLKTLIRKGKLWVGFIWFLAHHLKLVPKYMLKGWILIIYI